jgi:hypothetical protein
MLLQHLTPTTVAEVVETMGPALTGGAQHHMAVVTRGSRTRLAGDTHFHIHAVGRTQQRHVDVDASVMWSVQSLCSGTALCLTLVLAAQLAPRAAAVFCLWRL